MNTRSLNTLKGFNDYLPEDMRLRNYVINTFKQVYEKYGYEPLETPALEYAETLLGFSGEEAEKLMYRFIDKGGRDVIMRYEVMVPMCRVIAQYKNQITFPFKRYQIQQVWRADKPQKGRLREFTQCDADTIGTSSVLADAEFIQMGIEVLTNFGFKDFESRISNRKFLYGLMTELGIPNDQVYTACMAIDDLEKIGPDEVIKKLINQGIEADTASKIINDLNQNMSGYDLINYYKSKYSNPQLLDALEETVEILNYLDTVGVPSNYYRFDPTIARGLAHYTGPVWEFTIKDGGVGSVGGAGRYDNLIGTYLGSGEQIPATGGSFGIERMMIILKDRGMVDFLKNQTQVLVTLFDDKFKNNSITLANKLREEGINTLLYPQVDKLPKQFKYADKKGIPYVAILGPDEAEKDAVTLKNMTTGEQLTAGVEDITNAINNHE